MESQRIYFEERRAVLAHDAHTRKEALERAAEDDWRAVAAAEEELGSALQETHASAVAARDAAKLGFAAALQALRDAKDRGTAAVAAQQQRQQRASAGAAAAAAAVAARDDNIGQLRLQIEDMQRHLQQQRRIARAPSLVREALQQGTLLVAGSDPAPPAAPSNQQQASPRRRNRPAGK